MECASSLALCSTELAPLSPWSKLHKTKRWHAPEGSEALLIRGNDQPPMQITSTQGASASLVLTDVRNGGPYVWASAHTNLPGDANGDLMDGHANSTTGVYDNVNHSG